MKAIAFSRHLPISDPASLEDITLPAPVATGRDLVVRIQAVSVNPVDTKIRRFGDIADGRRILGWDAAGVVESTGPGATLFQAGDEVYYAGELKRPGTNAEFHLVDERLVGRKPASLSFAGAAAFPLVTITAWEALFERLGVDRHGASAGQSLLIIGGAGGVGSIAIQLAKLAGLTVIATASRPESRQWVRELGADHCVDHRLPLPPQLAALGFAEVDLIANFNNTDAYWTVMAGLIKPLGKIVAIVETERPVDLGLLKAKSATFAWEFMFTRSMFRTPDMQEQGRLLHEAARLIDAGRIRSIATRELAGIHAANLRQAHALAESGALFGKLVLAGW